MDDTASYRRAPFGELLAVHARTVEHALDVLLPRPEGVEARVVEAMRYAALSPGKRFRAFLVLSTAEIFNLSGETAARIAASVECLHAYALVHDDLPALDDDSHRRGRAAVHVAYDEATAILAGDGLMSFAFEVISAPETHPDGFLRADLVLELARAAGAKGLVGGQAIDVTAKGDSLTMGEFLRLQRLKTGALFAFCCEASAILARAPAAQRLALHAYAHDLGLAYQMADDLLGVSRAAANDEDVPATRAAREQAAGRATFLGLLGEERARDQARLLSEQAIRHLDAFDGRADSLRAAAVYAVERLV